MERASSRLEAPGELSLNIPESKSREAVMFRVSGICISIFLIFLTYACDKKHNPVNSPNVTYSITGSVKDREGSGMEGMPVHLTSTSIDSTVKSAQDGTFQFTGLPSALYAIEVLTDNYFAGPKSQQISVKGDVVAGEIILIPKSDCLGQYCIFGKITTNDNLPVMGAIINFSVEGLSKQYTSHSERYYSIIVPKGKRILLTPSKAGYEFTFNPPNFDVLPQDEITICNFTAVNNGPPLHSISGRTVDRSGEGLECRVILQGDYEEYYFEGTGLSGNFSFPNLKDGVYHLTLQINPESGGNRKEIDVTLNGEDVALPDVVGIYKDTTIYMISGKVTEPNGDGIPDIPVTVSWRSMKVEVTTGIDGNYQQQAKVGGVLIPDTITYTLKPHKDGFLFTPDSTTVTLSRVDDVKDGGTVTVPDFIGTDYTVYTAADYFYLSPTASWTYERTVDGGVPEEQVTAVTGSSTLDGRVYRVFAPAGPGVMTAFRIEGNSVYTIFESMRTEFLKFAVVPGTTWRVGTTSGGYPVEGTFLGVESVSTPAGTFPECLKYEVKTEYGTTSYLTYTLWFAKGMGMIRSERVLMNYGEMREHVVDVLKRRAE
jgi:hypothetical protein